MEITVGSREVLGVKGLLQETMIKMMMMMIIIVILNCGVNKFKLTEPFLTTNQTL